PVIAIRIEGLDSGGSSPGFDLIGIGVYPDSIGPLLTSDTDDDGIDDALDNCVEIANSAQVDADLDQFGNRCDADFNNDCIVNAIDLGYFRTVFFTADPLADLNADGIVNAIDLGLFRTLFFSMPGPSGFGDCMPAR
ncbi:MAG: thrombospondin type 3 repeat-containing protein, partial [Gammaproteobacteria bacterium]